MHRQVSYRRSHQRLSLHQLQQAAGIVFPIVVHVYIYLPKPLSKCVVVPVTADKGTRREGFLPYGLRTVQKHRRRFADDSGFVCDHSDYHLMNLQRYFGCKALSKGLGLRIADVLGRSSGHGRHLESQDVNNQLGREALMKAPWLSCLLVLWYSYVLKDGEWWRASMPV